MTSLNQQRRIEVLEAQLGEAEDIVKDLRTELRELQDELEKVTINHMQPWSRKNSEVDITTHVTALEENRLNNSGSVISSLPAGQCEPLTTLEMKDPTFNGTYNGNKCYSENGPQEDNCFACNPDFASIMMRSKEPELYRNGCTQRIRAFERNLLGGNLSLSGQANDVKNQIFITEDEEDKHVCANPTAVVDNMCSIDKSPDEIEVMQANGNSIQVHDVKSFRRKRKRGTRYKKYRTSSFKSFPDQALNNNVQSRENSRTIENISPKDPESPMAPKSPSNTNKMFMESGSAEVTKSDAEFSRACTVQNTTNNDNLMTDELGLRRQKAGSKESSECPASKTDLEIASVLLLKTDAKESDEGEVLPTQPMDNKILKYTFRRKRKKEFPSTPDGDSSFDDGNLKRKIGEKQSDSLESQKSCLITESSRDSRRLAQVARQVG